MYRLLIMNMSLGMISLFLLCVKQTEHLVIIPIVIIVVITFLISGKYTDFLYKIKKKSQNSYECSSPYEYYSMIKSPILCKSEAIFVAWLAINYFDFGNILSLTKLCENHFKNLEVNHPVMEALQKNNREKYLPEVLSNIREGYKNNMFFKIDPDWLILFGKDKFIIEFGKTIYEVLKKDIPKKVFDPLPSRIKNVLIDFTMGSSNYGDQEILKAKIKNILYRLYDKELNDLEVSKMA